MKQNQNSCLHPQRIKELIRMGEVEIGNTNLEAEEKSVTSRRKEWLAGYAAGIAWLVGRIKCLDKE